MKIRESNFNDLLNIATLHTQSWRENYADVLSANYLKEEAPAERTKVWTARLSEPANNQMVLVAEVDGAFCGFICAFGAHHSTYGTIIDNLHVKSNVKGQGLGSKLLVAAAKWASTNYGNSDLYLEVLACNTKAIGFYESLGAKKIDVSYWQTPCGNKAKEYIYSWGSPGQLAQKAEKN